MLFTVHPVGQLSNLNGVRAITLIGVQAPHGPLVVREYVLLVVKITL